MKQILRKFLFVILVCAWATSAEAHRPPRIIDATVQQWHSGVAGGGRTMQYYFSVRLAGKQRIRFDSVWMDNSVSPLEITPEENRDTVIRRNNNQRVMLFAALHIPSNETGDPESREQVKPPKRYRGKALLRYYIGKKPYYYIVKKMRMLPDVYMP